MTCLAVNDRSDTILGVSSHAAPYLHDIAASGVDHLTAALFDFFHEMAGSTKGWHDHHIVRPELVVIRGEFLPWQ